MAGAGGAVQQRRAAPGRSRRHDLDRRLDHVAAGQPAGPHRRWSTRSRSAKSNREVVVELSRKGRALVAAPDPDRQEARADRERGPAGQGSGGGQARARPDVRQSRRRALMDSRPMPCAGRYGRRRRPALISRHERASRLAPRAKGPLVFLDMDQQALDDAYDQEIYAPNRALIVERRKAASERARAVLGIAEARGLWAERARGSRHLRLRHQRRAGQRVRPWRRLAAQHRRRLRAAGRAAGARRRALRHHRLHQCRSGRAAICFRCTSRCGARWPGSTAMPRASAATATGIYISAHSSGSHLSGVVLTRGWREEGLPPDFFKGAVLLSGMYDLAPVRAVEALGLREIHRRHGAQAQRPALSRRAATRRSFSAMAPARRRSSSASRAISPRR